ncbi:MAG: prepilin-type N-terminal cleavage/methylation domain-containing protein [Gemmatimonadota bacterium]|nr:prepilin-type N-terminal cleavage/methylation domain-containing protein [Gemmatimonadota bacterium]
MRRAGFSLWELMVAVVVVAMLASMGLLRYREERTSAAAAAVVADVRTVARAALAYEANTGSWPPDADRGQVPPGLIQFLPAIEFSDRARALEWDKFGVSTSGTGYIAGITLSAADRRLMKLVIGELRGEYPYFVAGGLVTWVLPAREDRAGWSATGPEVSGD